MSRTGYTGEDGFELIVGNSGAAQVWEALLESGKPHGVVACGLGHATRCGSRPAMPLYGHELSDSIDPFSAGLAWAVKLDKGDFVGREALERFKERPPKARVGLVLEGKRIARQGSVVFGGDARVGEVTSGTFSPTLQVSLAMAYVEPGAGEPGTMLTVDVRGHREPARVVKLPFYKRADKRRQRCELHVASSASRSSCNQYRTENFTRILIHGSQIAWIPALSRVGANARQHGDDRHHPVCRRAADRPDHDRASRRGNEGHGRQVIRRDRKREGGERPLCAASAAR